MLDNTFQPLDQFYFWCQKVLPLVYDNSLSYYEVLCKVTDYLNKVIENQNYLNSMLSPFGEEFQELKEQIEFVEAELEKVKNGDYVSLYIDSLANWIDNNLQELVGRVVKYVMFGLTNDGYFCAYIPFSWQFLSFDTVVNTDDPMYGHLILRW